MRPPNKRVDMMNVQAGGSAQETAQFADQFASVGCERRRQAERVREQPGKPGEVCAAQCCPGPRRALRPEIPGMGRGFIVPNYVALDLHRDDGHRCRLEPNPAEGAQMKHSRFPNTRESRLRFIETETGPDTWVAFEVTGNAFDVCELFSPYVGKVFVTNASAAKERGSGRKTDRVDSERLALGLAQERFLRSGSHRGICACCAGRFEPGPVRTVGVRRSATSYGRSCAGTGYRRRCCVRKTRAGAGRSQRWPDSTDCE